MMMTIRCPECGDLWSADPKFKGHLCLRCSAPITDEEYKRRLREREPGLRDPFNTGFAHEQFNRATKRSLGL